MKLRLSTLTLALAGVVAAFTTVARAQPSPAYEALRYDEDFSVLRDPARRTDPLDVLKFIPLDAASDRWLTLGGESRSRYEYFSHEYELNPLQLKLIIDVALFYDKADENMFRLTQKAANGDQVYVGLSD